LAEKGDGLISVRLSPALFELEELGSFKLQKKAFVRFESSFMVRERMDMSLVDVPS